jgi:ankyrin repeat protein
MRKQKALISTLFMVCFACVCCLADEIHEAARRGDLEKLKVILDKNPSAIGSLDKNKNTPLHHAIDENKLKAAQLLIKSGSGVNGVNYKMETPLHIAAYEGNAKAIKLLLNHGADYTLREMRHRIPLFLATNWGHNLEAVKLLVEAGSDVNDRNVRGESVLVSTLYYGKKEIIHYLIDRGATLPEDERTLRQVAYVTASNGMKRPFGMAVNKLEKKKADWWTRIPMQACARGGSLPIARALIAKGVPFNKKDLYGVAPIHIAAEKGKLEMVRFLLAKGVDINTPSLVGKTPLHYAGDKGHKKLVKYLISKGASQKPAKFPILKGDYLGQKPPGDTPERFAPGIVSGHGFNSEHSPAVFSPDLKEVYWTAKFKGPILFMVQENGIWSTPQRAPFNSKYGDGEPIFSPDGKKLFFLSLRPLQPRGIADKENMWFVERTKHGWSDPKPVSPVINAYDLHWLFSVASNGNIYFSSVQDDGFGSKDIYFSEWVKGQYSEPRNLGKSINTKGIEHTPYIAPDESYLVFVSTLGSHSFQNMRFMISYRKQDGTWGKAKECNPKLRSIYGALCPAITPDGKYMFFIGNGDIYWIKADFIKKRRPRE